MNYVWKDVTSYQRGEERVPRSWEMRCDLFSVCVTRHISMEDDCWCLACYELGIRLQPLSNKDLEAAKLEAFEVLEKKLDRHVKELQRMKQGVQRPVTHGMRKEPCSVCGVQCATIGPPHEIICNECVRPKKGKKRK